MPCCLLLQPPAPSSWPWCLKEGRMGSGKKVLTQRVCGHVEHHYISRYAHKYANVVGLSSCLYL